MGGVVADDPLVDAESGIDQSLQDFSAARRPERQRILSILERVLARGAVDPGEEDTARAGRQPSSATGNAARAIAVDSPGMAARKISSPP